MEKRIYIGAGIGVGIVALVFGSFLILQAVANRYVHKFEPEIRNSAIQYLERRFKCKVELAQFHIRLGSQKTALGALWSRGRGVDALVEGDGLVLRAEDRPDLPPLFKTSHFSCHIDLGTLLDSPRRVPKITFVGFEINVPPKGSRPTAQNHSENPPGNAAGKAKSPAIEFANIEIKDATLRILPRPDAKRTPLVFEIQHLDLQDVSASAAMSYQATLTNPKPHGQITSQGSFGPWNADEPAATPLAGTYVFKQADLGVFPAIAGILESTGDFQGELSTIAAKGKATVPDFRLTRSGNPVALSTEYEAEIDGTNGNTILKSIDAVLGSTHFHTGGAVIKHIDGEPRAIDLVVDMPAGNLPDLLRLALKGPPMMSGVIRLNAKIHLPPLSGRAQDKLILDGTFNIAQGLFREEKVQGKLDELSKRAQGEPNGLKIGDTFSAMKGEFHLENGSVQFRKLGFTVPGAGVRMVGSYDMDRADLDFLGTIALDAKPSQMLAGWKRWLVKPLDPLFSKNGAGTFLGVTVKGDAHKPHFGIIRRAVAEQALAAGQIARN